MRIAALVSLVIGLAAPALGLGAQATDPLAVARHFGESQQALRCSSSSILCLDARLSLMESASYALIQDPGCEDAAVITSCDGEAGVVARRYVGDRPAILNAALDLFPGTGDPRFQARLTSALSEVAGPCALGAVVCTDGKLAVLAQADHIAREMPCGAQAGADCAQRKQALIAKVDAAAAGALSKIFAGIGWPTTDRYGRAADESAWLLVNHTTPVLQKRALALAQAADRRGLTNPVYLPTLTDVVARNDKRPQTYGTQGACQGGVWKPDPIAAPAGVEARRADAEMETLASQIKRLSANCP